MIVPSASSSNCVPFFLSVGLLNPHDICSFVLSSSIYDGKMPFPDLHDSLPPLPPNFDITMKEPQVIVNRREKYWGDHGLESHMGQWEEDLLKFYMWSYYRYIEKVDGLIGVILDALARSPFADAGTTRRSSGDFRLARARSLARHICKYHGAVSAHVSGWQHRQKRPTKIHQHRTQSR